MKLKNEMGKKEDDLAILIATDPEFILDCIKQAYINAWTEVLKGLMRHEDNKGGKIHLSERMPEVSWVRLTAEEVKEYFCSILDKNMPNFDGALSIAKSIHSLVEQGKIKAYKTPEGTVEFQYNIAKEICPEGDL